eukprot:GEMP01040738.1.p1 GENE.GEMP01040738.1~~GEMP01040738.1.p1  ORF type:complete len:231 (+),score=49.03 GEMP01040738.1:28-693(+)
MDIALLRDEREAFERRFQELQNGSAAYINDLNRQLQLLRSSPPLPPRRLQSAVSEPVLQTEKKEQMASGSTLPSTRSTKTSSAMLSSRSLGSLKSRRRWAPLVKNELREEENRRHAEEDMRMILRCARGKNERLDPLGIFRFFGGDDRELTMIELCSGLRSLGITDEQQVARRIFSMMDPRGIGNIGEDAWLLTCKRVEGLRTPLSMDLVQQGVHQLLRRW